VSFATINLCVASQQVFVIAVVVDFIIVSVWKRFDTPLDDDYVVVIFFTSSVNMCLLLLYHLYNEVMTAQSISEM
jgi:hypothetical protein